MDNPLAIYLRDHLAGAAFAVDLLEAMRDKHPNRVDSVDPTLNSSQLALSVPQESGHA